MRPETGREASAERAAHDTPLASFPPPNREGASCVHLIGQPPPKYFLPLNRTFPTASIRLLPTTAS